MPDILCKQCDALITDPCVKLEGLFLIRTDLSVQLDRHPDNADLQKKIDQLDELLDTHLGMNQEKVTALSLGKKSSLASSAGPTLFILTCFNGHRNQYSITCNT